MAGLIIAPVASAFGWTVGTRPAGCGRCPGRAFRCAAASAAGHDTGSATADCAGCVVPLGQSAGAIHRGVRTSQLAALTWLTTSLAVVQGCLFSFCVTYLVTNRGMRLTDAGIAYACMQGGGMVGRVLVGWAADRSQNAMRIMIVQAWASTTLVLVWAFLPAEAGLGMIAPLALLMGMVCASWPGLMLAEISRMAPAGRIADAASGSTMITFMGYVAGPMLFAQGIRGFGGWTLPYILTAVQMALMAAAQALWTARRTPARR